MKKFAIVFVLFIWFHPTSGQKVPSSCNAPDSIRAKYRDDANRLALRKIYRQHLSYQDSIIIPSTHSDTVMKAMLAVFNATVLHARDTIVSMLNIHSFPDIVMNSLIVSADSSLPWMKQLKFGHIPTGNSGIDKLLSDYHLTLDYYYSYGYAFRNHDVTFSSSNNYNLQPLTAKFFAIQGVSYSVPNGYIGDGDNIWDTIYSDHVSLIYSHGWGDCPAGCTERRNWKFNVYFDCSVEYIGSYGSKWVYSGIDKLNDQTFSIYPNPFADKIYIHGISQPFEYSLRDILGQEILAGKSLNNYFIENLNGLKDNIYFLTIKTEWFIKTFKLFHEK